MKMHKTYKITLALLAALLAVIGVTTTVVQAEGPEAPPDPAQILTGQQLDAYNGLTAENQEFFRAELLPQALQDVHPDDHEQATGVFVNMMKRSQDSHAAAQQPENELTSGGSSAQASSSCRIDPDLWHSTFTNRVYSSNMASCDDEMQYIVAGVQIRDPDGTSYRKSRRVRNTSAVIVTIYRTYEAGRWGGYYDAKAEALPGSPSPGPISSTTLFENF